ncbi:hypothetical protein [Rhizobium sp. MHM7A]|uniref:hypothetical protein n=1 Tax=Rhizobium sp. MHM7A TaxID=2583233 RepID=UPI0011063E6A|nr:hypothetical protein [Rhizobium sp. MHM7A]TLX15981.1 hypothetical protein FFR93_01300 [Rhizobium sp. MHM7A]
MTGFVNNDGGRAAAGFKPSGGDCVARSIAIITGRPYIEVYRELAEGGKSQRGKKSSPRSGMLTQRKWFKDYMAGQGFEWVATMTIGSGCKVHLTADELPKGRLVASVSKHYTAMIDGVIHDTSDPRRGGERCVYGYWIYKKAEEERSA